jgi:signal transduction histidine kinase/CheY-like chemotaxis protein/GAF domain-containing protein
LIDLPLHRAAFAALPLPATLLDAEGVILDVNDAFLAMARSHGRILRREERVGRPIWQFAGEDDPHLGRRAILEFLAGDEPRRSWQVEERSATADSAGIHDMTITRLRDSRGLVGALVTRLEVTEAVAQAQRLEESEQIMQACRRVGHLVLSSLDLEHIVETISLEVVKAGILRSLTVALVDEEQHCVEVVCSFVRHVRADGSVIPGSAIRAEGDIAGLRYDLDDDNIMAVVARSGELTLTGGKDERFDTTVRIPEAADARVCYFIPVRKGDRVLAVLASASAPAQQEQMLGRIDMMAPLLDQAAIAIEHARLYRETRRSAEATRVRLAVEQVRNEILQMHTDRDWGHVIQVLGRELAGLVDYHACGINLVVDDGVQSWGAGPGVRDEKRAPRLPAPLEWALETGRPHYRRTAEEMESAGDDPKLIAADVRCVVDVPFGTGTLAVNHERAEAFDDDDIAVMERFAAVMGEGHRRLRDLQALAAKERQLLQSQKMEAIGQLTAGVAHNFNNMLQAITGNLDLARLDAPPSVRQAVGNALETSYRAAQMVQQLMVYARQNHNGHSFEAVDPAVILREVADICRRTFDRRLAIDLDLPEELPALTANALQLEQVLLNLCINSRDALEAALPAEPCIHIGAAVVEAGPVEEPETPPRRCVRLRVRDNGPGMNEATRQRIFEPFFTTKDVDKGTGLGLSTAQGIAQEHDGWIECTSAPGAGATFDLFLPASAAASPPIQARQDMSEARGTETVLVVDDEEMIRHTAMQMLQRRGFTTLTAGDGDETVQLVDERGEEIDIVLLDHSMPRMSGLETLAALRRQRPALPVIIITGFPTRIEDFEGADELIQKPFSLDDLAGRVRAVLDRQ